MGKERNKGQEFKKGFILKFPPFGNTGLATFQLKGTDFWHFNSTLSLQMGT